ncbi:hypothetical protein F5878DRAFT_666175 [Lentinula raphanica]|uniref:Uncharacterized protein n=1 Tax=Lentinula raphanica TaxID=153919 RepID=A0AA38NY95_9AGAR|nr:hypothetical protein F5880DRAFT_1506781 [Lentinula raphanica]KAJ3832864.1 hypothetical protein F5878DRAFT_666175 [Lentinula raphanica]
MAHSQGDEIPPDFETRHHYYKEKIEITKLQFMRDLVSGCKLAFDRNRLECDLYALWDSVLHGFTCRTQDPSSEISVKPHSQFRAEFQHPNGHRTYKVPDNVVLEHNDTNKRILLFWVEVKALEGESLWFTDDAKTQAEMIVFNTIAQINAQAQYLREELKIKQLPHAVLSNFKMYGIAAAGPYFNLLEYTNAIMSPNYFSSEHARRNARVTRAWSRQQAANNIEEDEDEEEDDREDPHTQPRFPLGSGVKCLFTNVPVQEHKLNLPINEIRLSPDLLDAFRLILEQREEVRAVMQNITWFDCNVGPLPLIGDNNDSDDE